MLKKVLGAVSIFAIGFGVGYMTKSYLADKEEKQKELDVDMDLSDDNDDDDDDDYEELNFKEVEDDEEDEDDDDDDTVDSVASIFGDISRIATLYGGDEDDDDDEDDEEDITDPRAGYDFITEGIAAGKIDIPRDKSPNFIGKKVVVDVEEYEEDVVNLDYDEDDDEETMAIKDELRDIRQRIAERERILGPVDIDDDDDDEDDEDDEDYSDYDEDEDDDEPKEKYYLSPDNPDAQGVLKFVDSIEDLKDKEKTDIAIRKFITAKINQEVEFDGTPIPEEERYFPEDEEDEDDEYNEEEEEDDEVEENISEENHGNVETIEESTEVESTEDEEDDDDEEEDEFNKQMKLNIINKAISTGLKDVDLSRTNDPDYVDEAFYQCGCGKLKGKRNLNLYCKKCSTRVKQMKMVFDVTGGGGLTQTSINPSFTYTFKPDEKEKDIPSSVQLKLPIENHDVDLNRDNLAVSDEEENLENHPMHIIEERRNELISKYYKPIVTRFKGKYQPELGKLIDRMAQPDFDPDAYDDYTTKLESCAKYYRYNEKGISFLTRILSTFDNEYHIFDERN